MQRLIGILGIATMIGIIFLLSSHKKAVKLRTIGWGLGLQFAFALIVLKTAPGKWFFLRVNDVVIAVLNCAQAGASFVFGNLVSMFVPVGQTDGGGFTQFQDLVANSSANPSMYHGGPQPPRIVFINPCVPSCSSRCRR